MAGLNFKKAAVVKKLPLNKPNNKKIIIWGEPITGKTQILTELAEANYLIDYINLDNNMGVFDNASDKVIDNINNISVNDSLNKMNKATFFEQLITQPAVKVCGAHGYIDCVQCKNEGGDSILYNPAKSEADIIVIDSVSAYLESAMIKGKGESVTAKTTFNNFGEQGLHVDVLNHFVKACPTNVIVISHILQMANTLKENYTDDFYPMFGTRPKSKRCMSVYSHIVKSILDKDTYQLTKSKTHYATLRDDTLEKKLKGKTRLEILETILGKPKTVASSTELQKGNTSL